MVKNQLLAQFISSVVRMSGCKWPVNVGDVGDSGVIVVAEE